MSQLRFLFSGSAIAATLTLLCFSAQADHVTAQDRQFVEKTAKGGMLEVHLGKLGVERASSAAVKNFAQRLIDDHTKVNTELADLARSKNIALPPHTTPDTPKELTGKTGAEFDRAFIDYMIADHEKDIAAFENQASTGGDPDLKSWVAKKLPALREHLAAAKSLARTERTDNP